MDKNVVISRLLEMLGAMYPANDRYFKAKKSKCEASSRRFSNSRFQRGERDEKFRVSGAFWLLALLCCVVSSPFDSFANTKHCDNVVIIARKDLKNRHLSSFEATT